MDGAIQLAKQGTQLIDLTLGSFITSSNMDSLTSDVVKCWLSSHASSLSTLRLLNKWPRVVSQRCLRMCTIECSCCWRWEQAR